MRTLFENLWLYVHRNRVIRECPDIWRLDYIKTRAHAARMREPESRPGGQIDRPSPEPPPPPRTHPHDTPPGRVSGNMSSPTDGTASPVGTTSGIALRDAKRKDTRRSYHHSVIHEKTKAHRSVTDLSEDIFDRTEPAPEWCNWVSRYHKPNSYKPVLLIRFYIDHKCHI